MKMALECDEGIIKDFRFDSFLERFDGGSFLLDRGNVFLVLKKIYQKNTAVAFEKSSFVTSYNSDLLNLVASVPLLMISYLNLRRLEQHSWSVFYVQRTLSYKIMQFDTRSKIDIFNMEIFGFCSKLLKKGEYPWGDKEKIYFNTKLVPLYGDKIQIPFFMDKVIQESLRNVLVSIYEPYFDVMNCSFGFRPGTSVHDAIYAVTNRLARGLDLALKGNVPITYDEFCKKSIVKILEKKIKDKKFLYLVSRRLNNEPFCEDKGFFLKKDTDWLYLWNIYLMDFDCFMKVGLEDFIGRINFKIRGPDSDHKLILNPQRTYYLNRRLCVLKLIDWIFAEKRFNGEFKSKLLLLYKTRLTYWKKFNPKLGGNLRGIKSVLKDCKVYEQEEHAIVKDLQRILKRVNSKLRKLPFLDQNKKRLSFIFSRYADTWILLTNFKVDLLKKVSKMIIIFFKEQYRFSLSDQEAFIINLRKDRIYFLGFEIRTYKKDEFKNSFNDKSSYEKMMFHKINGCKIFATIDKKLLLQRLYREGFCDRKGFPREVRRYNNLEVNEIIDRTNKVLLGVCSYFIGFISSPRSSLSRWIYIITYSCLKTLAMKYKTSLKKIFCKFRPFDDIHYDPDKASLVSYGLEMDKGTLTKYRKLLNLKRLLNKRRMNFLEENKKHVQKRFLNLYNKISLHYEEKEKPVVLNCNNFFGTDFLFSTSLKMLEYSSK